VSQSGGLLQVPLLSLDKWSRAEKWNGPIRRWHPLLLKDFHWTKKKWNEKSEPIRRTVTGSTAEPGQRWAAPGHQLWFLHLTSLHGQPGQDQAGPCQVSRSSKASHAPCSADTKGQDQAGPCQVSRSSKAILHNDQQLNKVKSKQDYARLADPVKQFCTMISS
jgi:hypothetical protein